MSKKNALFLVFIALFFGCKDKNESEGDSFYKAGKYRQAVNSYMEARGKGKFSEEFYDNFVMAYAGAARQSAEKNPTDNYIEACIDQIYKILPNAKSTATLDSVVVTLSGIGVAQAKGGFGYEYVLQGFRKLDSASNIAKRGNTAELAGKARKEAEEVIVKEALQNAGNAKSPIYAEYVLLEAEVVAPGNEELQKALNQVRYKNREDFLIFELVGIEKPSRLVNKYGYVMSLPNLNIGPTSTTTEMVVWNQVSNNVDFDFGKIKMVSTKGDEVYAKVGAGSCYTNEIEGDKKAPIKGTVGKLLTEKMCLVKLSFSYPKGFVPNYVDYKDANNNIGRKYFGYK